MTSLLSLVRSASAYSLGSRFAVALFATVFLTGVHFKGCGVVGPETPAPPTPAVDPVMAWNAVALQALAEDVSGTYGTPDQGGPTRASRAMAIVHLAIFDAANNVQRKYSPYLLNTPAPSASFEMAVAKAAHNTLARLFPKQWTVFEAELSAVKSSLPDDAAKQEGLALGERVANALLDARAYDGSELFMSYDFRGDPGQHQPDPLNPDQGVLTPGWGKVQRFVGGEVGRPPTAPPPALDSEAYAQDLNEIKSIGADGVITPTTRTAEQTEIGIYWAYDGVKKVGTPPRLYNQIARSISSSQGLTPIENARMFALVNVAMADAGVHCWDMKYQYNVWRPVVGIRRADEDGNALTESNPAWTPLGAPASNQSGHDFTPAFPSFASGHATFGAAAFATLRHLYGTDEVSFDFVSDELNGVTTDSRGNVRPHVTRHFDSFTQAINENAMSRLYLGVHWRFDAVTGVAEGQILADHVYSQILRPVSSSPVVGTQPLEL